MIRAGYFRDKLGLLAPTTSADPAWGSTQQFTPAGTIWAAVTPVSAIERVTSGNVQTAISHRITIRWRDDVTDRHRLVYRGRVLEIAGVFDPDGRRRELTIEAREYPAEGGANV